MRSLEVVVVVALALACNAAVAQPTVDTGEAAYQEGRRLYDLRAWDRAIEKFKEAYELRHDAASLFNIAQAYRLKGDCAAAHAFYKTYARNFPDASNLDRVNEFISQLEPCAKAQQQSAAMPPVGTAGAAELVRPQPAAKHVDGDRGRGRRRLGLGIAVGGAVVGGASLVAGALARSTYHDALEHCDETRACDPEGLALGNQARTRATAATVLGAVGLASVATGVIVYVTAPASSESVVLAPIVGPDRAGLAIGGRF